MGALFLSYRGADTGGHVLPLKEILKKVQFSVFLDRDSIPLGVSFAEWIREALAGCDAVLALIGPAWVGETEGRRRIDEAEDVLHRELAIALALRLIVVPVLFAGTRLPTDLPADLAPLADCNPFHVELNRLERDFTTLAVQLERSIVQVRKGRPPSSTQRARFALVATVLWTLVAGCSSVIPKFPAGFWVFPALMALVAFLWLLASLPQALRPNRPGIG